MAETGEVSETGGKPLPRAMKVQIKRTKARNHGFPGQNVKTNSCNQVTDCEYIVQVEEAKDATMKPPVHRGRNAGGRGPDRG